jgi:hypothetical protein
MSRPRIATLALAAGLGLLSGCASMCEHPLWPFGRSRVSCCPECEMGGGPCCDGYGPSLDGYGGVGEFAGPGLEEGGPGLPPPGPEMMAPGAPEAGIPPLAPPPRLVPQPQQQAPAEAYNPTAGRIRRLKTVE